MSIHGNVAVDIHVHMQLDVNTHALQLPCSLYVHCMYIHTLVSGSFRNMKHTQINSVVYCHSVHILYIHVYTSMYVYIDRHKQSPWRVVYSRTMTA